MKLIIHILLLIFSLIFCLVYSYGDLYFVRLLTILCSVSNIVYAFLDYKKRFVFLAFNITFLLFLLGQDVANFLSVSNTFHLTAIDEFSHSEKLYIYLCLFVSLQSVFWTYSYFESKGACEFSKFDVFDPKILSIRKVSKKMMYLFYVFALLVALERVVFVQTVSYVDFYVNFTSYLPAFVYKFASLYEYSFFLFLATLPLKKDCKFALILYILLGTLTLGYGQRNGFVLNVLFVFIYLVLRDYMKIYGRGEVWLKRKYLIVSVCSLPFFIFFLYSFNYSRNNMETEQMSSLWDTFLAFFYQQGGSVKIIGLEKHFSDMNAFPNDFPYSLGYFVDMFQQNYLFKLFNLFPDYPSQTYELAVYGHNYSATISYLNNSQHYYMGLGLGSCYIAEIIHDFGIVGLLIINILYAFLFAVFYKILLKKGVWGLYFMFIMITAILYAPRSGVLDFFTVVISITQLLFVLFVYLHTHKRKIHVK